MAGQKIKFCGGVSTVTGAQFFLKGENTNILIDCGMTQGFGETKLVNYKEFSFDPKEIDFVFITHAHTDHIGLLPKLIKDGFNGVIYSTPPTKDLAEIMYDDAYGHILKESKDLKKEILYSKENIDKTLRLWKTLDYDKKLELSDEYSVILKDAGHILGSSIVVLENKNSGIKTAFTGDLGNTPSILLKDTSIIKDIDYLITESVYGDRVHEESELRTDKFISFLNKVIKRGGTILIPSFSIEKTQIILYELNEAVESGKLESVPVFLDSPLASRITEVYKKYPKYYKEEVQKDIEGGDDIFDFPKFAETVEARESDKIRNVKGSKIIIAGSGMSVGGRVLEHEIDLLPNPKNAILFLGYQVVGSLGRKIQEKNKKLNINKKDVVVRAEVESINGYSSHKDLPHILEFIEPMVPKLKKVFVVMGEPKASLFLAQEIKDNFGVTAVNPNDGEFYDLD